MSYWYKRRLNELISNYALISAKIEENIMLEILNIDGDKYFTLFPLASVTEVDCATWAYINYV